MDGEIKGGGQFFFSFLYFVIFILTHTYIYINVTGRYTECALQATF